MNPFKWLVKGTDAADKALNGILKGADALIFTDEEKASYGIKAGELWLKIQAETKDENSVRSVTRRIMACLIVGPYVLLVMLSAIVNPFAPEQARFMLDIADGKLGFLAIAAGSFYFGAHLLRARK